VAQSFPLEPGEAIVLQVRRHWIAFWPRFLILLALAGLPAGFTLEWLARAGWIHGSGWRVAAALAVLWVGFWLIRAAVAKYRYDHDIWLLTNQRLIGLMAPAPFRSSTTLLNLDEIMDVRAHRSGPAAILLRYGDVECRSRAGVVSVVLRQTSRPEELALRLQQICRPARRERGVGEW